MHLSDLNSVYYGYLMMMIVDREMEKFIDLFNELLDVVHESGVDSGAVASVLLKLSALHALRVGMTRSDFLHSADVVYRSEAFMTGDVKNLTMQ